MRYLHRGAVAAKGPRMRDANGSVQLLEADPELGGGSTAPRARGPAPLRPGDRRAARAAGRRGRALTGGSQPIGLLVLEGLLVREATVGDHPCAELLGPGDLLRAWDDRDTEVLLPRTVEWSALTQRAASRSSTRRWPCGRRSGRRSSPR